MPASIFHHFDKGYSTRCEVIFYCGFDLHYSNDWWCWVCFHLACSHSYVILREISVRFSAHFLITLFDFLLLSCLRSLYILSINTLSDRCFLGIFLHSAEGNICNFHIYIHFLYQFISLTTIINTNTRVLVSKENRGIFTRAKYKWPWHENTDSVYNKYHVQIL